MWNFVANTFRFYMDPLIMQLTRVGLGSMLLNEFYGCLLYADDILLITHTVHDMHPMLHCCDKYADDFDIRFKSGKSVAMRIGKRFSERCVSLQTGNRDIVYVSELKYLGVHVIASQQLKFSVEHLRSKFYRTFNCVYSKSLAANSELVTVELMKSYCLPGLLYASEAICLTTTNIRTLDNCINRALYKIYNACDNDSLLHLRYYLEISNVNKIIETRRIKLMDKLVEEMTFAVLCNVFIRNLF